MREIKFRAWDKKYEELRFEMTVTGWQDGSVTTFPKEESGRDSNDFELMQFTGLKDKNGKEIYEGDIVRFAEIPPVWPRGQGIDYEAIHMVAVVEWDSEGADFQIRGGDVIRGFNGHQDIEVLGNIYENPELLESK